MREGDINIKNYVTKRNEALEAPRGGTYGKGGYAGVAARGSAELEERGRPRAAGRVYA